MKEILGELLNSSEPSIRFKAHVQLLSEDPDSKSILALREEIKSSLRVGSLLSERKADDRIPWHPYAKWDGAHWILAALADIGYPSGDKSLVPLREQVHKWLLSKEHVEYTEARPYRHSSSKSLIPQIKERPRIHASMEGNAIWYLHTLGLFDRRAEGLVDRLMEKQWPDGGWNCDGNPKAMKSSFMETILPLRALALHAKIKKDQKSREAAERAAEVFLKRRLYKREKTGNVINPTFTLLHYPCYWHYDILFALRVMAETGYLKDKRCEDALDLLEDKQLKNGGFPATGKYYKTGKTRGGRSLVQWGPVNPKKTNEFVTIDALTVLKAAGRWTP